MTSNHKASMFLFRWLVIVGLLCLFVAPSVSYKILLMPPTQGSHLSCLLAIARELGRRQHETHILIDEGYKIDKDVAADAKELNITFLKVLSNRDNVEGETAAIIGQIVHRMVNNVFPYKDFLKFTSGWSVAHARLLLLENEPLIEKLIFAKYDLAVIDGYFNTKHFYLLVHRLGIPWITSTNFPDQWTMRVPWLPSFVPGMFSFQTEKMSFLGRISNAWLSILARFDEQNIKVPDDIIKQYQQYGPFNSPDELMERSKFWILTSDAIINSPKPIMPNMIEVGGLTTQPAKKLSEDIQSFLDGAEDGVIVLSFGSMMSWFPDALLRKFFEAFNRIERHRIIWRLTNISSEFQIPDFIRPVRWMPQNDILAHPKVKLFITHCGNNGQFEALYHGIPMLGFSFIADQFYNAIRIESKGFGMAMNVHEFTSDELYTNVMKVLNDPSYKRRISLASEIYRSAPQRPAERAAFWIEHVIRFGSDHLQSAGKDLNFFQFYMFDALALFLVAGLLLLFLMKKIVSWIAKKIFVVEKSRKLKSA